MAELYGTREDAEAYHSARGNTAWATASSEAQDAALVRASQGLDALYGARYPGAVADAAQALLWPRRGVTYRGHHLDEDAVPLPIIRAAYELALRELNSPGSIIPDFDPSGTIKRERKKLGPLEQELEYASPATASAARPAFVVVDGILAELLLPTPGGTTVTSLARF